MNENGLDRESQKSVTLGYSAPVVSGYSPDRLQFEAAWKRSRRPLDDFGWSELSEAAHRLYKS